MEPDPVEPQTPPSDTISVPEIQVEPVVETPTAEASHVSDENQPVISAESATISPASLEQSPSQPISPDSLASAVIPPDQLTPQLASLFQTWFASYQRKIASLGLTAHLARKRKKMDHIVDLAGKRGSITRQDVILALHMSPAQVDRYLHDLVAEGKLRHVGAYSHGKYERV